MQKVIFGIFAHPDDEAFGPSGYFLQQVKNGAELHLITLTLGQNGTNPDGFDDLGAVREREWREGGHLMGATSQHDLGYIDGYLCNIEMIEAAEKIQKIITDIAHNRDIEIEFVTSDLNGISGHIDHIVAARAASLVFYRQKQADPRFKRIRYSCIPQSMLSDINIDWLFMEPGRSETEISETVDTTALHDEIIAIMRAHHTQRGDGETHIKTRGDQLGIYSFIDKS